jgi:MYXO-CTERM domain-containing protein
MKRLWMSTASAALAMMLWSPQAQAKGGAVDAFLQAPSNRSLPESASASHRGLRVNAVEGRLGVPTMVFSEQALRSGLNKAALRPATPASADAAAREHLRGVADLYRMTRSDVDGAVLQHVHVPKGEPGAVIARYGRRVGGIEVFRSEVKVVMDANQDLVAISGYLAPRNMSDEHNAQPAAFRVSAPQAIARAVQQTTGATLDPRALAPAGTKGDYSHYKLDGTLPGHTFGTEPRVKKVLFPMPDELVPAYYVEVNAGPANNPDAEYHAYVINARDGSVLFKHNLTASESFTYRVWADPVTKLPYDGPQGIDATPHPTGTPDGYQAPLDKPANLVTLQNYEFSRNDPWLLPNATQTTGNNVDAYADLGGSDGFQVANDVRAPLSNAAERTFDYQYDLTKSPDDSSTQRTAAVVNLFYMVNFLHDWYYDAGFDEASGNAQMSNFGRGGLENDSIRAEAQDYGGRNNANMSTPADGARPRMQQYVFDGLPELAAKAPANLVRVYESYGAVFGPQVYDVDKAVALPPTSQDAATNTALRLGCVDDKGGSPYTGTPFDGKIALIERGVCSFAYKVLNAQKAGAVAVIITNSAAGALGRLGSSGVPAVDNAIEIPSMLMPKPDGDAWRTELANGVTVQTRLRKTKDLDRDGTLDNDIIAHEWGHYISNRLVGNAVGLSNHQGRSMGEGWGDFTALLLQVRKEDANHPKNVDWTGTYAAAAYTQSGGRNQGYYWGIRRVPYSTDMSKNGLTLKHIANGVPLPSHPVASGANGVNNAEVHNAGEVWATMLWECYATLLNRKDLTFEQAQDRMKKYLVAAYKATPNQPTFLEARDALLATVAARDTDDYNRFLAAFAKRGAGFGASVSDRNSQDHIGVVESFETGNVLQVVRMSLDDTGTGCDRDGVLDAGETGSFTVTVRNAGASDLTDVNATAAFAGSSDGLVAAFKDGANTLQFGNIARGATATARVAIQLNEAPVPANATIATLGVDVTFPVPLPSAKAGNKTVESFRAQVNYDEAAGASDTDAVSTSVSPWTGPTTGSNPLWKNTTNGSLSYWHGADAETSIDASLASPVFTGAADQNFILSFKQRYSFETDDGFDPFWEGGVLELSVDGGAWHDVLEFQRLAGSTANAGYVNYIYTGNPILGDRPGYVGLSTGFPNFQTVTVNFGKQFAGKQVRVRFRIGTDTEQGAYGWDVDDIKVVGITNTKPFPARVAEAYTGTGAAPACNMRPVAEAGQTQTVEEFTEQEDGSLVRNTVILSGAGSFDPDFSAGGVLTYEWKQTGGPAVTLSDATAVAPSFPANVSANTVYTFQLVVSDGTDVSLPKTTQVAVVNVNRAPTAVARVQNDGPTTVDERSGSITLDASGSSDPDAEPLGFTWIQTAGPEVELDDPTSATPTFTPPEVTANTNFTFDLVADDGIDAGEDSVTITVRQVDRAPVALAGANQTVRSRATVTLAGSAADPDGEAITSYVWTQVSGPTVTLTGGDTATPSFTAPNVKQDTVLRFSLVASAAGLTSAASTVDITVTRANRKPTAHSSGPMTVNERSAVKVVATAEDEDGDALTYHWTQLGGPSVALTGTDGAQLSFTAPDVQAETALLFRLQVRDDQETSESLDVVVTVKNQPRAPTAQTRSAISANVGETVSLSAASSTDPDGQLLTYKWEQLSGPSLTLSGANTAVASFVVPETDDTRSSATFRLTVTDPDGLSSSTNVLVQLGGSKLGGCSVGGNGGALVPGLAMLGLLLGRRRRKA